MVKLRKSRFVKFPTLLLCACVLLWSVGGTQVYANDYVVATTLYIEIFFTDGTTVGQTITYDSDGTSFTYTAPSSQTINQVVVSQAVTGSFAVNSQFTSYCTLTSSFNSSVSMRQIMYSGDEAIGNTGYVYVGDYEAGLSIDMQSSTAVTNGNINKISTNVKLVNGGLPTGFTITISNIRYDYQSISEDSQTSKSILDTVKGIFTGITDLPSNIASAIGGFFDNVVSAITSLPVKIKESLTSLFDSVVSAVVAIAQNVADKFTSIFDSWFETDSELDDSVSDGSGVVDNVGSVESDLISGALDDINGIDFLRGFSNELVTAALWLLPFQDNFFGSLGLVKDVVIIGLTIGLVTLLLGRGLRVFIR